jgi:hypothetical protein
MIPGGKKLPLSTHTSQLEDFKACRNLVFWAWDKEAGYLTAYFTMKFPLWSGAFNSGMPKREKVSEDPG